MRMESFRPINNHSKTTMQYKCSYIVGCKKKIGEPMNSSDHLQWSDETNSLIRPLQVIGSIRSYLFQNYSLSYLFLNILFSTSLYAQFPTDYTDGEQNSPSGKKEQKLSIEADTLSKDVFYFNLKNPSERYLLTDTAFQNFHIYDPIRLQEFDYVNTGNLGGAHQAIVYQPLFHKGFTAGFNNYDLYKVKNTAIRYYQVEKAYSDVAVSQGNSQEALLTKVKFSKNIAPLINLALDYQLINNEGIYTNQRSKNNSFVANTWYHSPSDKYKAFLSYNTSKIQQKENGGVDFSDTLNLRKSLVAIGRPVNITTGESRYFQRELTYSHYYELGNITVDSTDYQPSRNRKYTLFHQLNLRKNTNNFFDESSDLGRTYYGNFLQSNQGINQSLEYKEFENTFSIRTYQQNKSQATAWGKPEKNKTTKDLLEVGLTHTYTALKQTPVDSNFQNVFIFGNAAYTPSSRLRINTCAHLGILGQIGDYYVKGDALVALPKIGALKLGLIAQHYAPNLLQQQLYVSDSLVWKNDFSNTFENSFLASYSFPFLNLTLKGQYHLISNYIYYNELAQPQQAASEVSILQLSLKNHFRWKGFLLENDIYLQNSNQSFIPLPAYYSIHRLSYQGKIFKKVMDFQAGAQVRINTPYFTNNFQPVTAQFFLQNQAQRAFYPTIDAFINIKIKDFRFFINVQNIYDYFTPVFDYPVYSYPAFDSGVRFGFRWKFLDNNTGGSGPSGSSSGRQTGRRF